MNIPARLSRYMVKCHQGMLDRSKNPSDFVTHPEILSLVRLEPVEVPAMNIPAP